MILDFNVPNLACSACVEAVTQAVKAVDASAEVVADPKTKAVSVTTQASAAAIQDAITAAGYTIA